VIVSGHALGVCLRCLAAAEPLVVGVSFKPRIPLNLALAWRRRGYLPACGASLHRTLRRAYGRHGRGRPTAQGPAQVNVQ
jgi:hypothetical protein